ncbi:ester cyclase [Actinomycetospora sp. OC33-EN08]|uniref:Ester cyclase n=1 Tax=Actinomycetospora aurantiaca TaxID=3129233 RepID=A0ABU8MRJ4_9PSEU
MPTTSAGPPAPTPPGADATPGTVVRWTFDVLNTHHAAPLRAVWTDETRERMPGATYRGADEIEAYFSGLFAAVPDLTLTMQSMVEQGEEVFVRWTLTGTHTGAALEGIEPTGKRLDIDGVDHFTVRDGVIVSNFVIYDQMQFARQLGLLPADGSRLDVGLKWGHNLLARLRG